MIEKLIKKLEIFLYESKLKHPHQEFTVICKCKRSYSSMIFDYNKEKLNYQSRTYIGFV